MPSGSCSSEGPVPRSFFVHEHRPASRLLAPFHPRCEHDFCCLDSRSHSPCARLGSLSCPPGSGHSSPREQPHRLLYQVYPHISSWTQIRGYHSTRGYRGMKILLPLSGKRWLEDSAFFASAFRKRGVELHFLDWSIPLADLLM